MPMDYDKDDGRTVRWCGQCYRWMYEMCNPDTCPNNRPLEEDPDDQTS